MGGMSRPLLLHQKQNPRHFWRGFLVPGYFFLAGAFAGALLGAAFPPFFSMTNHLLSLRVPLPTGPQVVDRLSVGALEGLRVPFHLYIERDAIGVPQSVVVVKA